MAPRQEAQSKDNGMTCKCGSDQRHKLSCGVQWHLSTKMCPKTERRTKRNHSGNSALHFPADFENPSFLLSNNNALCHSHDHNVKKFAASFVIMNTFHFPKKWKCIFLLYCHFKLNSFDASAFKWFSLDLIVNDVRLVKSLCSPAAPFPRLQMADNN